MTEKVTMSAEDTETIIVYSQFNIGDWVELYTTDKIIMKRFEKFSKNHPDYCRFIKEDKYSMTFSVHPKCACIYPKAPRKVILTEEQRQERAERLQAMRNR